MVAGSADVVRAPIPVWPAVLARGAGMGAEITRSRGKLPSTLSVCSTRVGALLGRLHNPEVGVQTRPVRQVEPSPRFFRPAVCRVVSQTTWTGLAVAAQCLVPLLAFTPSAASHGRAEYREALR